LDERVVAWLNAVVSVVSIVVALRRARLMGDRLKAGKPSRYVTT